MISGKAMIECGTGSTMSTCMYDPNANIGMVLIKSKEPTPNIIGSTGMTGSWFGDDAEVKIYFHNIDSLKSFMSTFSELLRVMSEEDE